MTSLSDLRSCAERHLREYTRRDGPYAFHTYDHWWGRSPDQLTAPDVLAANLMSLSLRHEDVIPLFAQDDASPAVRLRTKMQDLLDATAAQDLRFEDLASPDDHPFAMFREACALTAKNGKNGYPGVPGWTAVYVSKVLHRLRPQLVPVLDSKVRKFYGAGRGVAWPRRVYEALHADLPRNRAWLEGVLPGLETPDGRPVSLLRRADMLIWLHERTHCTAS